MSSYIDFWACKNQTPILLTYGSRSSELYQFFYDSVPYAQTKKLSKADINEYGNELTYEINNHIADIGKNNKKLEYLKGCNLPIEELNREYLDLQTSTEYYEEQIKVYEYIRNFCQILLDIIEDDSAEVYVGIDAPTPYYKEKEI